MIIVGWILFGLWITCTIVCLAGVYSLPLFYKFQNYFIMACKGGGKKKPGKGGKK